MGSIREQAQTYYDDYSSWYERERRSAYYELINSLEFDSIADAVDGRTVLEVGCGTGIILERTVGVAAQASGVDLSFGMASVARRKGLTVAQAPATALPFDDASFDVVYSFKVLPHVPDIQRALAEIHRVLRSDGVAFLEFYSPWSLKAIANKVVEWRRRDRPVYLRFDSLGSVRRMVAGRFTIRSVRGVRIFTPAARVHQIPLLARIFSWLERRFCDSVLARFGGYMIVELGRDDVA